MYLTHPETVLYSQPKPRFFDTKTPPPLHLLPDTNEDELRDISALLPWAKPLIAAAVDDWRSRGGDVSRLSVSVEVVCASEEDPPRSEHAISSATSEVHAVDAVHVAFVLRTNVFQWEYELDVPLTDLTVAGQQLCLLGRGDA